MIYSVPPSSQLQTPPALHFCIDGDHPANKESFHPPREVRLWRENYSMIKGMSVNKAPNSVAIH